MSVLGWLADLVQEKHERAIRFSEIARRLRKSPEWPRGKSVKESSLATYLGELDRGRKREWFGERPMVWAALATFLKTSSEELDERLEKALPSAPGQETRIQLWDVDVRRVDLRRERLPAVFPSQVLEPSAWPLLWHAPSGSGRTLVGRWLEARQLARFIRADAWSEALPQVLGDGRPAFVELLTAEGFSSVLTQPWQGPPACVAAGGVERPGRSEFGVPARSTWPEVSTPPAALWLGDLTTWVAERLRYPEGFDPEACLRWMNSQDLLQVIDGFGTALGFIGLHAGFGKKLAQLAEKGDRWANLAKFFLRMRASQVEAETDLVHTPELLEHLRVVARKLLTDERPWDEARSWNEWLELVPPSPQRQALEYLSDESVRKILKVDPRALQAAAAKIPPPARAAFDSLRQLNVLRAASARRYALHPRWLASTMLSHAAGDLLDGSWKGWGAALLRRHGAPQVMFGLFDRCFLRNDHQPIAALLKTVEIDSPAWVAAVEAAFRAIGLSLFLGDTAPRELASEVFALQRRLLIERRGIPYPRVTYGERPRNFMLTHGGWLLAAHALVDALKLAPEGLSAAFSLQGSGPEAEATRTAMSVVSSAVTDRWSEESLQLAVFSFYGRLLPRTGPIPWVGSDSGVQPLQFPEHFLQHLEPGKLSWKELELRPWEKLFPVLRRYAEERKQSWPACVEAIWRAFLASGERESLMFSLDHSWGQELWALAPPEVFASGRMSFALDDERFPYDRLRDEQWSAFLEHWKRHRTTTLPEHAAGAWRHMPPGHIRQAIADGLIALHEHSLMQQLWLTARQAVWEELERLFEAGRWDQAMALVWAAPPGEVGRLVSLVRQTSARKDAPRPYFINWLHDRANSHVADWEHAWALLNELSGVGVAAPASGG